MRVVIIGPAHPLRGGIASFNQRLATELDAQGHKVVIYSFKYQYPKFLFPGKQQTTDAPPPEGVEIHTVLHSLSPFNWWRVGRQIAAGRPDIVVCRYWLPFMAPCLGTVLRVIKRRYPAAERIGLIDNILPHERRPGDKLLTRYFTRRLHRFVAMSDNVVRDLQEFLQPHQRVNLVPHPLFDNYGSSVKKSEARAHLGIATNMHVMLFFGFIRRYKGLDLLLEAMATPAGRKSEAVLLLAGEFYGDEKYYLDKINQLELTHRVLLHTRYIPESEVRYYFGAADVAVQPYRSATQSGITQVAYHFGLPMVVTDVGGLPEMVPHEVAGLVVAPDSEEIGRAIARIFDDTDLYQRLCAGVIRERERFGWAHFTEVLLDHSGNIS
jgi:glycosyltransferase involved in cell wall biosynthesis